MPSSVRLQPMQEISGRAGGDDLGGGRREIRAIAQRHLFVADRSSTAQLFYGAPPFLRRQPFLARGGARSGRPPFLGPSGCLLQQRDEAGTRGLAVLRLRSMLPTVDQQDAAARHATAGQRDEPLL